ncbi:hypothetical protein GCM10011400_71320 [Paraburkholderia caffeinilytica]|uniref:Uncharacterized protein n=2 Tax=Paraburkholderia caffeinilytica TaxID=1761016 RepID=A0ABQ1NDW5_9BURK|nr:hypothetical protein GCM10011400_71320 [Paraburkholderia caffeinilytica]CAB3808896.1 hypothetical protein LMG28690_07167 [Paraburkholderia caffeinilytica]
MDSRAIIARNCTWSSEYDETSFTAILHERQIWERDQYWLLEWALYALMDKTENCDELCGPVFRIFSCIMVAVCSHFDENDLFEIENLTRDEIYEFRERIQIVFEGFFSKHIPERVEFAEPNPLLNGGRSS